MRSLEKIRGWMTERFPRHPHLYFGVSGTTLLFDALQREPRDRLILPAFICPSLSAMAQAAGKKVTHVDVNPSTMLPDPASIEASVNPNCALLIDHSFGYAFPAIGRLRARFPELLIVEDCARALGVSIRGQNAGEHSDWILFSLYKTIPGSRNGAMLLSRTPLELETRAPIRVSFRERFSNIAPLRVVYDLAQRRRASFAVPSTTAKSPHWIPEHGSPNTLCLDRFADELEHLDARSAQRRAAAAELIEALSKIDGVECIESDGAGHFVSFKMRNRDERDRSLNLLQRHGLFLSRTWDLLPFHYDCFATTSPDGAGSRELWNRIAHIPVRFFLRAAPRRRLIRILRRQA